MSRTPKEFQEYVAVPTNAHVGHEDYLKAPGSAFLKYTVEAKCAIDLTCRSLPKKANTQYTKNSLDSIQHLTAAMVPAIMGHFETYQRYLFAGMFDASAYLEKFSVEGFMKRLAKEASISIDPVRLAAHRGLGAQSIGLLMSDSLNGWQNPRRVNLFFDAFGLKRQLYSEESCAKLEVLWQMRHAIVHTGGTLTLPDAQKVPALSGHGNKKLVFEDRLVYEISRKLHPLIKKATVGMGTAFKDRMVRPVPDEIERRIEDLFTVKSSCSVWLRDA